MKINTNVEKIVPYKPETVASGIQRCHYNEAPEPILPIKDLIGNAGETINQYPDKIGIELIAEASRFYNITPEHILAVNGSDEGIDLIVRSLCNPGDSVVVLNPTFFMYKQYSNAFGVNLHEFSLDINFRIETNKLISFVHQTKPKIVFIPNPLAPTGDIVPREDLIKIVEQCPDSFIVSDEAYIEFSDEKSMIDLTTSYRNLIVLRTLSKFFGLAGLRLGFVFGVSAKDIIKIKSPYNVGSIVATIGVNLLKAVTPNIMQTKHRKNKEYRAKLEEWLKTFSEVKRVLPSHAGFLYVELNCKSTDFANKLLTQHNMKIRAFDGHFDRFCRISVMW